MTFPVRVASFSPLMLNGAVRHMNKSAVPRISHQLHHLEPLSKVQALSGRGNIDTLIEIVGLFPVYRCRDITGRIEGGAVLFSVSGMEAFRTPQGRQWMRRRRS